ncbi:hypothetical protein GYMLUDRAFT_263398 [Collybiopsis luxurians FD-317 M1]|uniref:Terpene synthase n=1 Tax=Collybiopsis luxurians FD-317 M1 TaxID=944289 RepID=A0A0D0CP40_9AGAR|nr:hypothetical protein GYMLUDRAFT_263398 [Collybiopsis luxurians FD-317 M1]
MAPFTSEAVDTSGVPTYFGSFPVKTSNCEALPTIRDALRLTIQRCTVPGSKERKKAEYRHTNPTGHLFGLCLPMVEKNRLKYAVQLVELLCIVDDVMEDLPFGEACIEHAVLRQALYEKYDKDQYAGLAVGGLKSFLRELRVELLCQKDPNNAALLRTLDVSLHKRDSVDVEFENLETYIPYRKTNFDYDFVCKLIRWSSTIPLELAEEEEKTARKYEHSIGVIVGLTNDYFSWEMEHRQPTDRIRNAIAVLMKEHGSLSDKQAKSTLKDVIVDEEQKAWRLKSEIDANEFFSTDLKKYVLALQLFAAGYSFWCATSPRYGPFFSSDQDQS